jgi:hypothetical protein
VKIKLNAVEQRLARHVAAVRAEYYRTHRPETITLYGSRAEDFDGTMLGSFGAELAYAKLFNAFPPLEPIDPRCYDVHLFTGQRVDVKWTPNPEGPMQIKLKAEGKPRPDLYALMVGEFPEYRLAGHIDACDALIPETICETNQARGHVIPQSVLRMSPTKQDMSPSRDG